MENKNRSLLSIITSRAFIARFLHMMFFDGVTKSFGVIVEPVVSQGDLPYRTVGWIFTWQLASCYLATPFVTVLLRSEKIRLYATFAGFCVGLGYIGLAWALNISLWLSLLMTSLSGAGLSILLNVTVINLKTTFSDGSYARAYAMSCLGTNFGIAVFPLIMSFLEELYGTTDGLSIFGAFLWNTAIVGLITTTCSGSSVDNSAGADYDEENQVSHDDHMRWSSHFGIFFEQPLFITFFVLSLLVETSFVAWAIYLVPYGESMGLEPNRAALLSTIGGTSGLLGKIFLAMVANFDSLHPLIVFTIPSLIIAFSYLTTFFWSDFAGLASSSVMSGFCIGFQGSGRLSMLGLVVSDEYFKSAVTWLYSGYILSTLSGGIVAGFLRDISGNFQTVFGFLAVVCLLNAAISLLWILSTTKEGWKKSHSGGP